MRFINRKNELKYLKETEKLSKRKLFTLAIMGLRRVGKTRLIKEFMKKNPLYFFVNKNKTSLSLLNDFEEVLRQNEIIGELENIKNWRDFFKVVFERYNGIVIFDEFQNFLQVDSSVLGLLQEFIDRYEEKRDMLIIFCGSLIGLMKKIFEDTKEPLYGRIKRRLLIKPMKFKEILEMKEELKLSFEDTIKVYSLFGGFPLYWVAIEDENLAGKNSRR